MYTILEDERAIAYRHKDHAAAQAFVCLEGSYFQALKQIKLNSAHWSTVSTDNGYKLLYFT